MTTSGAQGVVVWFTGLPSSGKSTLAGVVRDALRARGVAVVLLDGDEVRASLRPAPGYDDAAREAFYETLGRLAALLARQGHVVLVPATANRAVFRSRARSMAPRFIEVFVDTPADVCRARDAKGLYARAASSTVDAPVVNLPGADAGYERPTNADVTVAPGEPDSSARVVRAVLTS